MATLSSGATQDQTGASLTVNVTVATHVIRAVAFPLSRSFTVSVPSDGVHEVSTCP